MEAIIPIKIYEVAKGYHMRIEVLINNQVASLILDTGASISVFDENRISKLTSGIIRNLGAISSGASGVSSQKEITIKLIQIGFLYIEDYNAAVMDLNHINNAYENLEIDKIDGIIGNDILNFY